MTVQFASSCASWSFRREVPPPSQARCVFKCPDSGAGAGVGGVAGVAVREWNYPAVTNRAAWRGMREAEPSAGGDGRVIQHRSASTTGPEERRKK